METLQSRRESSREFIAHCRESDGAIQSLANHLQAVGHLSAKNASKLVLHTDVAPRNLEAIGEILGLLHDLGKYSKEFQDYLGSAVGLVDQDADDFVDAKKLRGRIDHSTAGAQFIWRELSKLGAHGQFCGQILALCIASHHSGLIDCLGPDGADNFTRRIGKTESSAHLDEAMAQADASILTRVTDLLARGELLDDLRAFAQGIAAREHDADKSPMVTQFKFGLLVRILFSCLIDADRVDTADFERPHSRHLRYHGKYPHWEDLARRLDVHLNTLPTVNRIDQLRREISGNCRLAAERKPGMFTLTVPTGGGKTLASLRFSLHHARIHGLDRVIYVIPYTSIIDQNADVVRRILEPADNGVDPGSIVLEHHSNLTPDEQTWRAKMMSENWDAPVIFTTSVQLLESLFGAGTRGARRMHQLARSVIIFDEVQTVPVRCVHMFNNAINFLVEHCGSSVVLCTATQPLLTAVDPKKGAARSRPEDEIIPDVRRFFDALKRTEILPRQKAGGWTDAEVADLAAKEISESGSCLVIVNTRKAARSLYEVSSPRADAPTFHLSTSMCPAHRRERFAKIRKYLSDGKPVLCISTQLVEAGVDIDFGAVIRHVAGLDSIAQAAGRCNRNGCRDLGRVHIINPAEGRIDRLVDIRVGCDVAMRVLSEFNQDSNAFDGDLLGPKAITRYFDYYFFQRANEMGYPVTPEVASRNDSLMNLLAQNDLAVNDYTQSRNSAPPIHLRQAFMTAAQAFQAIDAPTQGVLVPYGKEGRDLVARLCGEFKPELQFDLLRRAQQFSVNVFPQVFESLQRADAVSEIGTGIGIYHLRPEYYSADFGLSENPVAPMETLNA